MAVRLTRTYFPVGSAFRVTRTLKTVALSFVTVISTSALVSCGGARTFGPGLGGTQAGSRYLSPNAWQQNNGAQFVEYPTQCSVPLGQISQGTSGASMWFTIPKGCNNGPGAVGKVEILTGQVTEYALDTNSSPLSIAENASYVWIADRSKTQTGSRLIYRLTEDGSVKSFALPKAILVTSMAAGSDGNLWFCGSYVSNKQTLAGVGYVTPKGASKLYSINGTPTPKLVSVASSSDGNLWIADETGAIDKVVPSTGAVTTYMVGGQPFSITNSSNALIYSDASAAQLSVITRNGNPTVYPAPSGERPTIIARKPDGSVLFIDAEKNSAYIGTFDPVTGTYGAKARAPNGGLRYLYNGPDGNMWFTVANGDVGAYLKFILTTNPATPISTCVATFTASETNYTGNFSVASQDTSIATVSPGTGNSQTTFTVTLVAPGSTSISVQDSMQNAVNIPVASGGTINGNTETFAYTGADQCFLVPQSVSKVNVSAGGGAGASGLGGSVAATIPVTPAEGLAIVVGGNGTAGHSFHPGVGGFNGGSGGGRGSNGGGGGGGGASDIRQGGGALANRVIVAGGGGGGGGAGGAGGAGGNQIGASGSASSGGGGGGGTQNAGGAGGSEGGTCAVPGGNGGLGTGGGGGDGAPANISCGSAGGGGGGGGGGGYYGGGGGGGGFGGGGGGGGGGSSYTESNASGVLYSQGVSNAGQVVISWGSSTGEQTRKSRTKAK